MEKEVCGRARSHLKKVFWKWVGLENIKGRILMFKIMHLAGTAWHQEACSDLCVSFDRPLHHNILKGLFWIVLQECFSSAEYVIWLNASAPGGSKRSKLESNFSRAKSYDKKPKGGYYSNSNRFAAHLEPRMVNLYCIHSQTKNAFLICNLLFVLCNGHKVSI